MQFFDLMTAVTISSILGIIAVYLAVVYKKGWLRRNAVETRFLCPNSKCRRPFAQPVLLADLSKATPESHPACPHCGFDLSAIPYFKKQKNFDFRSTQGTPLFKKPSIERSQLSKREIPKPGMVAEKPKPGVVMDKSRLVPVPQVKFQSDKQPSRKEARDCPHFFGYVHNLPKNTPIPDDCLGCPWIVECLATQPDKIEA